MNRTSPPCHVVSFLPIQVTVAPVIVVASIKPGSPLCNSHLPCIRRPVAMVERGVRRGRATTRKGGRSETYTGVSATEQDNLRPAPRRLASVVVVYVGAAAALFGWLEGWSFLDALYFSVGVCGAFSRKNTDISQDQACALTHKRIFIFVKTQNLVCSRNNSNM